MNIEDLRVKFSAKVDGRGRLAISEGFPLHEFELRRVYWMTDLQIGEARGFHAHHDLCQVAIPVYGEFDAVLDDGFSRHTIRLSDSSEGVVFAPMIWHEIYPVTSGCCILVLASDHYAEGDYIRDYQDFKALLTRPKTRS